jgi:membrane-associated protease RseP (regulator of RpoE activity)
MRRGRLLEADMQKRRLVGPAGAAALGTVMALALVAPGLDGQQKDVPSEVEREVEAAVDDSLELDLELDTALELEDEAAALARGAGEVAIEALQAAPIVAADAWMLGGPGPWIGVEIRDVGASDQAEKKLDARRGVIIERVVDESPAVKSGFKAGDVVVAFDGEAVRSARQFRRLVAEAAPDVAVPVTVLRDGSRQELSVTPSARSAKALFGPRQEQKVRELADRASRMGERVRNRTSDFELAMPKIYVAGARFGMTVQSLTPQLAAHFGTKSGLLVSEVEEGSAAAKAGVKAGDIITTVDGKNVESTAELRQAARSGGEGKTSVTLGIVRDKQPMSVKIEVPKRARTRSGAVL